MKKPYPHYQHHGAANGVTGSCHRYIASDVLHLLVDCGLFQGQEASNGQAIDFDISLIRALIVTHVHIDHIGRLPYLLAVGFKGPILCSYPSAKLLPLVIEDAFKIGFTRDKKLIKQFLRKVQKQLMPLAYKQWYPLLDSPLLKLRVRLQRAGHILGSAYVEIDHQSRSSADEEWSCHRTVFSGDLGAPHAPLLPAPISPQRADTLVIESTYGNRVHEDRTTRRYRLKALVEKALSDGGSVLIPAFSIGRTQELLYEFESIIHELEQNPVGAGLPAISTTISGKDRGQARSHMTDSDSSVFEKISIIVDSPLAAKFTKVYRELKPFWDKEALERVESGRHPLSFENVLTIDSHDDHLRVVRHLAETKRPAIVIAASGMAAGGRIVNYLKAMLEDPVHNVLFVGYQVPGTPGFEILKAGGWGRNSRAGSLLQGDVSPQKIELDGEEFFVRTGVEMVGGYSAHADQEDLLQFVKGMQQLPSEIRIVHGNDKARASLRQKFLKLAQEQGKTIEVVLPVRA